MIIAFVVVVRRDVRRRSFVALLKSVVRFLVFTL